MKFVGHSCSKDESHDPLNPRYFCKAWDGEGTAPVSCPKPENFNPEDCEFLVKPIQRFIPWLHEEMASEEKPIKVEKQKKTIVTKVAKNEKNKAKANQ